MQILEGFGAAISTLAFSPNGAMLAIGGRNGRIAVFEEELVSIADLSTPPVQALTFHGNGTMLLIAGPGGWYGLQRDSDESWNIHLPQTTGPTTSLVFLDGDILAIGTGDRARAVPGMLELRNIATGQRLEPRFREASGVRTIATHGPTRTVAWICANQALSVWNTQSLEPRKLGLPHPSTMLAFHPDGEQLAVAQNWQVTIYGLPSFLEGKVLKGHTGRVTALAYRPSGNVLATGSWDGSVRIWDHNHGQCLTNFEWGIGRIQALAFAPDGLRLAVGTETGTVVICDMD